MLRRASPAEAFLVSPVGGVIRTRPPPQLWRAKLHHNTMHQIISVKHEENSISSHSFHSALLQCLHSCLFHSSLLSLHLSISHTCSPICLPLESFACFLRSKPSLLLFCQFLLDSFTSFSPFSFFSLPISPLPLFLCPYNSFTVFAMFLLTHHSLFLLLFFRGMSVLLLAADAPAGQDGGVAQAEAEP